MIPVGEDKLLAKRKTSLNFESRFIAINSLQDLQQRNNLKIQNSLWTWKTRSLPTKALDIHIRQRAKQQRPLVTCGTILELNLGKSLHFQVPSSSPLPINVEIQFDHERSAAFFQIQIITSTLIMRGEGSDFFAKILVPGV